MPHARSGVNTPFPLLRVVGRRIPPSLGRCVILASSNHFRARARPSRLHTVQTSLLAHQYVNIFAPVALEAFRWRCVMTCLQETLDGYAQDVPPGSTAVNTAGQEAGRRDPGSGWVRPIAVRGHSG